MKRLIPFVGLLCLALILGGCGAKEEPAPAEKPAVEQEQPLISEPEAAPEAEQQEEAAPETPAEEEHEEHKKE